MEKREKITESLFKETIIVNFPNKGKMGIHFQEVQKYQTRWVEIHIDSQCNKIIKNQKLKAKIFESSKRIIGLIYRIMLHKIISEFFTRNHIEQKGVRWHIKSATICNTSKKKWWKKKKLLNKNTIPKIDRPQIKKRYCIIKQKLRDIITSRHIL